MYFPRSSNEKFYSRNQEAKYAAKIQLIFFPSKYYFMVDQFFSLALQFHFIPF